MRKPPRTRRRAADADVSVGHARVARSLLVLPLVRLVLGAESGGLTSRLVEHGLDDQFASDLHQQLEKGGSALVVLTQASTRDKLLAELTRHGGTLLRASLSVDTDVLPLIGNDWADASGAQIKAGDPRTFDAPNSARSRPRA